MYYRTMYIVQRTYFLQSTEYHAFCPSVGIASPHPLTHTPVFLPLFGFKGGDTLALGGGGGQTLLSTITPLRSRDSVSQII